MKYYNLKKKVLVLALTLSTALCFVPSAFANNHADSGWSAYLKGWNTVDTPNRQKQDASSGYIKVDGSTENRSIRAWMLGFGNENVGSATVYIGPGGGTYVTNYAYEWFGRKQVHMRLQNTGSYTGDTQAWGVWSPDSV